jgi:hypothetical protein
MNRLIQRLSVGIVTVGLLGAFVVAPAMASTAGYATNSQQVLENQINNEVGQSELAQAQQDLQTLEQESGYVASTDPSVLTPGLESALNNAINNGDWLVANAILNQIQDIANSTNGTTTPVQPTYTVPVTPTYTAPTEPTYTPPTYTAPTEPTYTPPTYTGQTQQANPYRFLPKDISRNNPVLQQSWAQQYLQQQASSQGSDNSWWFWQYLRQQQQQRQQQQIVQQPQQWVYGHHR